MTFKEGKIIEAFTAKDRREITIRYSKKSDVKKLRELYNKVIKETEYLAMTNPYTIAKEKKWLDDVLKKVKARDVAHIVAEYGDRLVGGASIERRREDVQKHVGSFGIAILQEFTRIGLGTRLMQLIEIEAKKMNLEIIILSVVGKNAIAQELYKKMGFIEFGRIPNFVKRGNRYDHEIMMYKVLK